MYGLNDKIKDLKPYEPISGNYKIRLDANESYLGMPEYISAEIAAKLLRKQLNRYPDPVALDLCGAFAKHYGLRPEHVVAGNGSDELISLLLSGFLMKGECFATLQHDFSMYRFYGDLSECRNVTIPKNADYTVDCQRVIDVCTKEHAKLLIFSNPCNPTSLGITADEVRSIISALPDTLVVVDEAYMDFWNQPLLQEAADYPNLLVLKTCSKAFGLAALRVGFAVGNLTLVNAIKAIKSPYNVNTVSQVMAETVLQHRGELGAAIGQLMTAKEEFYTMLKSLEGRGDIQVPESCTNFIVVRTERAGEIYEYLLSIGIAVRCFDGFLRITAGCHNENVQTVKFITKYLDEFPM